MTKTKIILIICAARTGSSVLGEYLERYVSLRDISELFWLDIDKLGIGTPASRKLTKKEQEYITGLSDPNSLQLEKAIRQDPITAINQLIKLNQKTLIIKILFPQISGIPIHELVKRQDTEVIVLRRKNDLARFVSHKKCLITGLYHENDTSDIQVTVDPIELVNDIQWVRRRYQAVKQLCAHYNKPVLDLEYETDLENFDAVRFYCKLDEWLVNFGISTCKHDPISSRFFKQNRQAMIFSVANYAEIQNIYNKQNN